jgi:hypothetical protein
MPRLTKLTPVPTPKPNPSSKRIAIVGAFPTHCYQAPFDDKSWEIWAMSAGRFGKYPRWDKWFELHDPKTYPRYERKAKGYIDFVTKEAVTQEDFPAKQLLEEFGPYFFTTGQITWLLAYAITLNPSEIGIWGVEAVGEYSPQRKDVHYFVQKARDRGIKVSVPENCTLLDKPKIYAFSSL